MNLGTSTTETTLRKLLTQQKPRVCCTMRQSIATVRVNWPTVKIDFWTDFELDNLNQCYGKTLDSSLSVLTQDCPDAGQELTGWGIHSAKDTNGLIAWTHKLLNMTLQYGEMPKERTTLHSHRSVAGGPAPSDDQCLPRKDDARHGPLRQLASLCRKAKTPYGYIQTNEDLAVCHFSMADGQERVSVKIMVVEWSNYGTEELTTDLALWWLSMMAISPAQAQGNAVADGSALVDTNKWNAMNPENHSSNVGQSMELPASGGDRLFPGGHNRIPLPVSQVPLPVNQAPLPVNQVPFLDYQMLLPGSQLPFPENQVLLPDNQIPSSSGQMPLLREQTAVSLGNRLHTHAWLGHKNIIDLSINDIPAPNFWNHANLDLDAYMNSSPSSSEGVIPSHCRR
ncbi:hypothetical protein C8A05DRAFT_12427 [Staphylotrichum tortipilum]|uniref:Uncharacterized protein n=1 Tax=Staphylotrichum tortipilum TaxID=2831512 RepID=A0AAN6MRK9_9PEZI|nr:hypothetical protein C8A05DRAFT_12427 [Staphylotrichum longicolle]